MEIPFDACIVEVTLSPTFHSIVVFKIAAEFPVALITLGVICWACETLQMSMKGTAIFKIIQN
jgi:hypothetical protein